MPLKQERRYRVTRLPKFNSIPKNNINVINAVDTSGGTALHYACSVKATMQKDTRDDQLEIVKHLLEREANIEAQDQDGVTPLHCASQIGDLEIVKHLLERGANIEAQDQHGGTPLHWASRNGHLEIVKHLLENRANIEAKDNDGCTPVQRSQKEEISTLLKMTQLQN